MLPLSTSKNLNDIKSHHQLTININLFKQINNQIFDKIQMILMMKMSISDNCMHIAIELEAHGWKVNGLVDHESWNRRILFTEKECTSLTITVV